LAAAAFSFLGLDARGASVYLTETPREIRDVHIRLYEHEYREWELHPARFDYFSPWIGMVFSNESNFETELLKWDRHRGTFEHAHPFLWRVLRGEHVFEATHGYVLSTSRQQSLAIELSPIGFTIGPGGSAPQANHPNDQGSNDPPKVAVPEPSSAALLLSAIAMILACRLTSRGRCVRPEDAH
jgi:hypothetical protein